MKMIAALAAAVVVGTAAPVLGQTRTITGTVTDATGRPVAGAVVEISNLSGAVVGFARELQHGDSQTWRATTDGSGRYGVAVSISGIYLVAASKDGVGSDQTRVTVGFDSVSSINLRLSEIVAPTADAHCATSTSSLGQPALTASANHPALVRLFRWLDVVALHTPGCNDAAVIETGRWPAADLEILLGDLANIAAFHRWIAERSAERNTDARNAVESLTGGNRRVSQARFVREGDRGAILLYDARFDSEDIERVFKGNETLRRGALLHADIAVFVPGNVGQYPAVNDGRRETGRQRTVHWQVGRQLLDTISPSPSSDGGSRLWYRAVSAHLFREGNLAEVAQHLTKARQVFPGDAQFLLDSAYLHLELSSPGVQAAVDGLRAEGTEVTVGGFRNELQNAERFLRETLKHDPGNVEAQVRLGHTLGVLGRHADAAAALRAALGGAPNREQRYLAELFLGREQQALGRTADARREYQNAATLFPDAQSPQLALASLARQSGDRAAVRDALRAITDLSSHGKREDPWHRYYQPHVTDAESLMREMRAQLGGAP
jgi:tetratricopeptide (TPR) repeat protein